MRAVTLVCSQVTETAFHSVFFLGTQKQHEKKNEIVTAHLTTTIVVTNTLSKSPQGSATAYPARNVFRPRDCYMQPADSESCVRHFG
jgi:hypothetical protein